MMHNSWAIVLTGCMYLFQTAESYRSMAESKNNEVRMDSSRVNVAADAMRDMELYHRYMGQYLSCKEREDRAHTNPHYGGNQ